MHRGTRDDLSNYATVGGKNQQKCSRCLSFKRSRTAEASRGHIRFPERRESKHPNERCGMGSRLIFSARTLPPPSAGTGSSIRRYGTQYTTTQRVRPNAKTTPSSQIAVGRPGGRRDRPWRQEPVEKTPEAPYKEFPPPRSGHAALSPSSPL